MQVEDETYARGMWMWMWISLEGSARRRRQRQGPSHLWSDEGGLTEQRRVKIAQLELKTVRRLCESLMRAQPSKDEWKSGE